MQRIKNISNSNEKKTMIHIDTPKSETSVRILPLPDFIIPIFKKLFLTSDNSAFFLTLSKNKFIEPRTLENKFKKLLINTHIPYKNFHVLRHTFANNMLDLGVDIKTLSEILGHSNVNVTLNEYIHSSFKKKQQQIDRLNQKFLENHM